MKQGVATFLEVIFVFIGLIVAFAVVPAVLIGIFKIPVDSQKIFTDRIQSILVLAFSAYLSVRFFLTIKRIKSTYIREILIFLVLTVGVGLLIIAVMVILRIPFAEQPAYTTSSGKTYPIIALTYLMYPLYLLIRIFLVILKSIVKLRKKKIPPPEGRITSPKEQGQTSTIHRN